MSESWIGTRYFDVSAGEPILNDEAALTRLEAGDETVKHIGSLLVSDEFEFTYENFIDQRKRREEITDNWDQDKVSKYGSWIIDLVNETGTDNQPLTQNHLRRMRVLGLGVSDGTFKRKLNIRWISEFRVGAGTTRGRDRDRFADWDFDKYVAFAWKLHRKVKRKLRAEDFDMLARQSKGPSEYNIQEGPAKSITNLNEQLWYPDTEHMTAEDIVFWGSRVMLANGGSNINTTMIRILRRRGRGPGDGLIRDRVGSWEAFKKRATEQYELDLADEDERRNENLVTYIGMIEEGFLPSEYSELSEDTLLEIGGRYLVVDACLPLLDKEAKVEIAESLTRDLANEIRNHNRTISKGIIERKAVGLKVFDDVWHLDDGLQYLKISQAELTEERRLLAAKQFRRYEKMRAREKEDAA